jgi:hypothetical protein
VNARRVSAVVVAAGGLFGLVVGALQLGWHFRLFFARAAFPLDLEWMEGGMLLHAARFAEGKNIYVPPSLDFIPYLYTPLYPALLAALSKLGGLGYLGGRAVSIVSFAAALALLVAAAAREGRGRSRVALAVAVAAGVAGAGVVTAGFVFSGTFYDLVRADSLLLLLQAAALYLALTGRGWPSAALAGLAIALAFFTKQTASVVGVGIGVGLLVAGWRRALVYGGVAAVTLALGLALLDFTSHGWFWTYVFKLHQSHGFGAHLAFVETPARIARYAAPTFLTLALAAVGLLLGGKLRRADTLLAAAALAGFIAACLGFGTQWAFENAFIPAVYFPAFAAAVLGARLCAHAVDEGKLGAAAFAAVACVGLGLQGLKAGRPDARRWVPSAADHAAAGRFLAQLRGLQGDVFIPFHPYYNVLVGKPVHTHRMGVMDVSALLGRPPRLDQALTEGKFAYVILDWKSQPWEWPTLPAHYHDVHQFRDGVDAVRSFSGAETSPRRLLAANARPAPPAPAPPAELPP